MGALVLLLPVAVRLLVHVQAAHVAGDVRTLVKGVGHSCITSTTHLSYPGEIAP